MGRKKMVAVLLGLVLLMGAFTPAYAQENAARLALAEKMEDWQARYAAWQQSYEAWMAEYDALVSRRAIDALAEAVQGSSEPGHVGIDKNDGKAPEYGTAAP